MVKLTKAMHFMVIIILTAAFCSSSTIACVSAGVLTLPAATTRNAENYTYVLPNYVVNYSIVQMPPPDRFSVTPYAYNIVVYGPPPFPIQISFYEHTTENLTRKRSSIMPTNAYSISIGCTSYPTQIEMLQVGNAPALPSPTTSPAGATISTSPLSTTSAATTAPIDTSQQTAAPNPTPIPTTAQSTIPNQPSTPLATPTLSPSFLISRQSNAQQTTTSTSSLLTGLIITVAVIAIAAVTIGAFMLAKNSRSK